MTSPLKYFICSSFWESPQLGMGSPFCLHKNLQQHCACATWTILPGAQFPGQKETPQPQKLISQSFKHKENNPDAQLSLRTFLEIFLHLPVYLPKHQRSFINGVGGVGTDCRPIFVVFPAPIPCHWRQSSCDSCCLIKRHFTHFGVYFCILGWCGLHIAAFWCVTSTIDPALVMTRVAISLISW